jgi:NitT/TauT family transport system substrate-binding protein
MHLRARGSAAGNIITFVLLLGIVALGLWLWLGRGKGADAPKAAGSTAAQPGKTTGIAKPEGDVPEPIEPVTGTPTLEAVNTYVPKDNVLRIDISEYAGYGGLIVANGGLDPNPDSFFAKQYGFQVQITMSESETWGPLNNG